MLTSTLGPCLHPYANATHQGTAASPGVIPLAIYDCFASLPKDRAFRFKVRKPSRRD